MNLLSGTTETRIEGGRRAAWLAEPLWTARALKSGTRLKDGELEAYARERLGELFPAAPESLAVEVARTGDDAALVIAVPRNVLDGFRARHGALRFATLASGPWKAPPRARIAALDDSIEFVSVNTDGELEALTFEAAGDMVGAVEARLALLPDGLPVELVAPRALLRSFRRIRRDGLELAPLGAWSAAHSGAFREGPRRNAWLPLAFLALVALAGHLVLGAYSARLDARRAALEDARKGRAADFAALAARESGASDQALASPDALAVIAAFARIELPLFKANRLGVDGPRFTVEAEAPDALAALEAARSEFSLADLRLGSVDATMSGAERFTLEGELHDGE